MIQFLMWSTGQKFSSYKSFLGVLLAKGPDTCTLFLEVPDGLGAPVNRPYGQRIPHSPGDIMSKFESSTIEELQEALAAKTAEGIKFAEIDTPTDEDISTAEALAVELDELEAEIATREEAATKRSETAAALRTRFAVAEEVEADSEETVEAAPVVDEEDKKEAPEGDGPPDAEDKAEDPEEEDKKKKNTPPMKKAAAKVKTVAELAAKVERPEVPNTNSSAVSITAAADTVFAAGKQLDGFDQVGQALVGKMRGYGTPSGDGSHEDLKHQNVASFKLDFPKELTIDRNSDDMEVLTYAGNERRLEGNSLVASNGWCAPSETLYDLCAGETLDGILSIPEVNVARGGMKYTKGPDFSDIYSNVGFLQTEAQAISGTTKACFEVPCPSFTDVRLDAIGICIKAPILTNAAYPELVNRWISGSMIAHQHKVNASVLSRMDTLAGAAKVFVGLGTAANDTLTSLELFAEQTRERYRLGITSTLEVVLPFWVKGAIRADLANRQGQTVAEAITDVQMMAHFAARGLNVQWVYDWQPIGTAALDYPATFNALLYPAGTFIKGVSDVINLTSVYDAASLAVNLYTGLFFEQGLLVANMCWNATKVTIPICHAGRTGAANLTCA